MLLQLVLSSPDPDFGAGSARLPLSCGLRRNRESLFKARTPSQNLQVLLRDVLACEYGLTARSVQFYDEGEMKMNRKFLRDVCAETGVTRRAVQGYEKAGLVAPIGKNKYGYLLYDNAGVERVRTIRFFQKIGFSIKEIRNLIDAPSHDQKEALCIQRKKLEAHSREISELIPQIERYISEL